MFNQFQELTVNFFGNPFKKKKKKKGGGGGLAGAAGIPKKNEKAISDVQETADTEARSQRRADLRKAAFSAIDRTSKGR